MSPVMLFGRASSTASPRTGSHRTLRGLAAAAVAVLMLAGPTLAATPSIAITSVGGQSASGGSVKDPVSGTVTVNGTSAGSGGGAPAPKPLVADAGDSSFVKVGQPALLVGAGFGGVEPYTFAWSAGSGAIEA